MRPQPAVFMVGTSMLGSQDSPGPSGLPSLAFSPSPFPPLRAPAPFEPIPGLSREDSLIDLLFPPLSRSPGRLLAPPALDGVKDFWWLGMGMKGRTV